MQLCAMHIAQSHSQSLMVYIEFLDFYLLLSKLIISHISFALTVIIPFIQDDQKISEPKYIDLPI